MTALYIVLGIIAFFAILLSIKITVTVRYDDDITLCVGWLFLKFKVLPRKGKRKPKKEKKKKNEIIPEPQKGKKKDNMFVRFYKKRGVSGTVRLLKDVAEAAGGAMKRIVGAFCFEEIYVRLTIGAGDSAQTAIKYGKVCAAAFPAMGALASSARVDKRDMKITPDFISGKSRAELRSKISVRPIILINAAAVFAVEFLFKTAKSLRRGGRRGADRERLNLKKGGK